MKELIVKDVLNICNGKLIVGNENEVCQNFSKDTRTINENDVYVGIKGEKFNGNLLYEDALKKGAKVCILENIHINEEVIKKYNDRTIITVENTIKAIQDLATYKRSLYNIPVIAVTGSVGKTSTKDILASVISKKYKVLKTDGNLNNHIGLPFTILKLKEHTAMIVEMGMNALGEIRTLTKIAKPTIGVITNIGTSHIGNLGSRQNILKAKLEILEGMEKDSSLVINNDNDLLHIWNETQDIIKVFTFGINSESDVIGKNIVMKENNSEFLAYTKENTFKVEVPIGGEHFIYNALCAILVGKLLKIPEEEIKEGIKEFKLTKDRMEILKNHTGVTIINDCYNANYDSMKGAIEYLSNIKNKRKIAVLGDMLELGEYSEELHKKIGEVVAKNNIDILVTVGKESYNINEKAKQLGKKEENVYHFVSNQEACIFLEKIMKMNDVVLVKASNGMHFKEIVNKISEL